MNPPETDVRPPRTWRLLPLLRPARLPPAATNNPLGCSRVQPTSVRSAARGVRRVRELQHQDLARRAVGGLEASRDRCLAARHPAKRPRREPLAVDVDCAGEYALVLASTVRRWGGDGLSGRDLNPVDRQ